MYLFPRVVLLFIFYPTKNHEKKKNNPKIQEGYTLRKLTRLSKLVMKDKNNK